MDISLKSLATLDSAQLESLMRTAALPDAGLMRGNAKGAVYSESLPAALKLWRGKRFVDDGNGGACGKNLLGLGPIRLPAIQFRIVTGTSQYHDREILLIDHDLPGNPASVRAYHDELVAVSDNICLASSSLWRGSGENRKLKFLCYFALEFPHRVMS